ncbi:hypothetical protein LELG_03849 [Lodderomyces elongisporus NRRL YB-4239]|uniref:CUE domain-containing protein n=1 Tax=Lodderomyces elongisporus (strain ATCC 11503 / CBS 2605 / JCM 1781 / NBRC 1676 / NRRL YB-4239) TaxID=379508 RepID=A5E2L2_LODEL|nr:hypothetical protein LELG_03849 [Lodderomyces elongisporus NRRL YB-4239]
MDSTTILFIVTIAVAFIFLRWMILPIPQDSEFPLPNTGSSATSSTTTLNSSRVSGSGSGLGSNSGLATGRNTTTRRRGGARPVTDSMIEVVQTIAPSLTVEQIRYDLEATGSVEVTIDKYMETGTLPFPPGYVAPRAEPALASNEEVNQKKEKSVSERETIDLIKRYGIDINNPVSGNEDIFKNRRNEMIVNARKRLAAQLQNQKI